MPKIIHGFTLLIYFIRLKNFSFTLWHGSQTHLRLSLVILDSTSVPVKLYYTSYTITFYEKETSWTLPAELTGSFYLFLLTPVMVNIKSAFLRNSLYLTITIIMKLTRSYNLYFHIGLWMADLSVQGAFDAFQKSRRILVVLFAWGIRLGLASMLVYFRVGRSWSYSKYIDRHWTNQMFSHGGEDQYKFYFNGS